MSIRIVIADDHSLLRAGLRTLLTMDVHLEVIGEATTTQEAIDTARKLLPDILLMDIGMPGPDTLEIVRQVVQELPDTRVLMLTMHEDSTLLQEYLRAGASGYIIKRAAESELIDAIYGVSRGMVYVHPSLMRALFAPKRKPGPEAAKKIDVLTSREIDILRLIVQGHTNRQIADSLVISVRTVETHRANLMDKLDLHSRVDLVRFANEHDLLKPNNGSE